MATKLITVPRAQAKGFLKFKMRPKKQEPLLNSCSHLLSFVMLTEKVR